MKKAIALISTGLLCLVLSSLAIPSSQTVEFSTSTAGLRKTLIAASADQYLVIYRIDATVYGGVASCLSKVHKEGAASTSNTPFVFDVSEPIYFFDYYTEKGEDLELDVITLPASVIVNITIEYELR